LHEKGGRAGKRVSELVSLIKNVEFEPWVLGGKKTPEEEELPDSWSRKLGGEKCNAKKFRQEICPYSRPMGRTVERGKEMSLEVKSYSKWNRRLFRGGITIVNRIVERTGKNIGGENKFNGRGGPGVGIRGN